MFALLSPRLFVSPHRSSLRFLVSMPRKVSSLHASYCPRLSASAPLGVSTPHLSTLPSFCAFPLSPRLLVSVRVHHPASPRPLLLLIVFTPLDIFMPSCLLVPPHLSVSPRLLPGDCTPLGVSTPILLDVTMACNVCTSQGSGISPIQDCI